MATLVVDDREAAIIPFLGAVPHVVYRITTADYVILRGAGAEQRILAAVERKTLADFAASLKDGRADNIEKLLALQREWPGCQLYYLVEGPVFLPPEQRVARIPAGTIESALKSLHVEHGVIGLRAKDPADSALELGQLVRKFDDKWPAIAARYGPPARAAAEPAWPLPLVQVVEFAAAHPAADAAAVLGETYAAAAALTAAAGGDLPALLAALRAGGGPAAAVAAAAAAGRAAHEAGLPPAGDPAAAALTAVHRKNLAQVAGAIWMAVPGVSAMAVPSLLAACAPGDVVAGRVPRAALARLSYTSGRPFNRALVDKLAAGLAPAVELKMLRAVPMLGQRADQLLTGSRLATLLARPAAEMGALRLRVAGDKTAALGEKKAAEILAAFAYTTKDV